MNVVTLLERQTANGVSEPHLGRAVPKSSDSEGHPCIVDIVYARAHAVDQVLGIGQYLRSKGAW